MSKKKPSKKKALHKQGRIIVRAQKHIKSVDLSIPRNDWPMRIIPPSLKVWDRGATFTKHELDTIEALAKYLLLVRKHLDGVSIQAARDVLKILSRKKI